jgi:hypothetical protein
MLLTFSPYVAKLTKVDMRPAQIDQFISNHHVRAT